MRMRVWRTCGGDDGYGTVLEISLGEVSARDGKHGQSAHAHASASGSAGDESDVFGRPF